MSKEKQAQKPTPTNDVFNLKGKTVEDAIGLSVEGINDRMSDIFGQKSLDPREATKLFHDNFTRKELAFMLEDAIRSEQQLKRVLESGAESMLGGILGGGQGGEA